MSDATTPFVRRTIYVWACCETDEEHAIRFGKGAQEYFNVYYVCTGYNSYSYGGLDNSHRFHYKDRFPMSVMFCMSHNLQYTNLLSSRETVLINPRDKRYCEIDGTYNDMYRLTCRTHDSPFDECEDKYYWTPMVSRRLRR